jgi:hypothetical protein
MLTTLVAIALAGFIAWTLLRARRRLREASSEAAAREAAFLQDLASAGVARPAEPTRADPPAGPVAVPEPAPGPAPKPGRGGGLAYLSAEGGRAFRLLRTALPDHEVFPRASLRRILGPLAPGKDLRVDFVVCSADFRPVAVVDLVGAEDLPPVVALKSERLAAAGVAYARWDGQALPSPARAAEILLGK